MAYVDGMVKSKDVSNIIDKKGLQYLILLGQRSNGKSYAVKERAVINAYKEGREFIYLRRYDEDIKDYNTELYFDDLRIHELTNGEYDTIMIYRKRIYLGNNATVDDEGKETPAVRGKCIGYVQSLNKAERSKSLSFGRCDTIIYEEFITDGAYLSGEVDRLANFVSTVFRDRLGVVCLVGNTISRICPYFSEWQLTHINKQKKGSVDIYEHDNGNGQVVKIGVYLTDSLASVSGMFFGRSAKMINRGEWQSGSFPHLSNSIDNYNECYTVIYKHDLNTFRLVLLSGYDNALGVTWYIEPKTTPIKEGSRVVCSNPFKECLWTRDFKGLNAEEQKAFSLLDEGYVVYSDNLTATEFLQCRKNDRVGGALKK